MSEREGGNEPACENTTLEIQRLNNVCKSRNIKHNCSGFNKMIVFFSGIFALGICKLYVFYESANVNE